MEMYSGFASIDKQKQIEPRGSYTSKENGGDNGCFSDRLGGCLARQNSQRLTFPWITEHMDSSWEQSLSLRHLIPSLRDKHVLVKTDNMLAVYYINHQVIALPPGNQETTFCFGPTQDLPFSEQSTYPE